MKNIFIRKSYNYLLFIIVFAITCGFLFFGGTKSASAVFSTDTCECYERNGWMQYTTTDTTTATDTEACINICKTKGGHFRYGLSGNISTIRPTGTIKGDVAEALSGPLAEVIIWVLTQVLKFLGWILSVAAAIFGWAADAGTLTSVINGKNIYSSWQIVRDLLNITFILVLLYTAFTIIFQVDKTNKKIILTVVLMALLVNFSFPVTRFIIDIGNSMMYTIFSNLFNGITNPSEIYAGIADSSQLSVILSPTNPSIAQLLAAIVFISILAMTFLMMAILFVIRIVILAIIIIFSPIGFVGVLFPDVSKKVDWWGNLFKYTFFGPIMAFMIYISWQVMDATIRVSNEVYSNLNQINVSDELIQGMSTFAIPIVVLWIGMGVAQKMGIESAAFAQKWATKAFKAATLTPLKAGAKAGWWGIKTTGMPAGLKQKWDKFKKIGFTGSDRVEERAARIAAIGSKSKGVAGKIGRFLGADALAQDSLFLKRIKEAGEKQDVENMFIGDLEKLRDTGDKYQRAAAIKELAVRGKATADDLFKMKTVFGETSQVFKQLVSKVKTYNPADAFKHVPNGGQGMKEFVGSNQFDASKLNADALGAPELLRMMFENRVISREDLEKQRNKSDKHAANIKHSLDTIIGMAIDSTDPVHQNIQKAYLQQKGELSSGAATSAAWQEEIFKTGDKDTFKRMPSIGVHAPNMALFMNHGKFKEIVQNMQFNAARSELVNHVRTSTSTDPKIKTLQKMIKKDFYLNSL